MSGMDRLTDAELHPLTMIDGSVGAMARELLAHRRASQAAPAPSDGLREAVVNDAHRFAVVSADFSRPFLLGAYPTIESAVLAQCGSPEKWPIYERAALSAPPAQEEADRHD